MKEAEAKTTHASKLADLATGYDLVAYAHELGYSDVTQFQCLDGVEMVQRKLNDGGYIWWSLDMESRDFQKHFKGFSRRWKPK